MEMTRFEKYLKEIEPYWEDYLKALEARRLNPLPGLVNCFDEKAYNEFRKQANLVLARIIAEEENTKEVKDEEERGG